MIVHEWGTFTALFDEQGQQLSGINIDTEPVPGFVHNLDRYILNDAVLTSTHWIHRKKAVPRHHPSVSLRMETPVIYFYPPQGMQLPQQVDVEVKFRGGWVTEFYPRAEVLFPLVKSGEFNFNDLSPQTVGQVAWRNLQIGTPETGPETDQHVWLAPRKVAAANITSSEGEHEKYIFYRGVAQQRSPLLAFTQEQGAALSLAATFQNVLPAQQSVTIHNLWLMETRDDGLTAYRRLEALPVVNNDQPNRRITVPRRFHAEDFNASNRQRLEAEMKAAILREGLFSDETEALLSTWQQAYFASPGLRVFYTVPREWTDHFLPLTISGKPKITRVIIGRLELISDSQRETLNQLATAPVSKSEWLAKLPFNSPALGKILAGHSEVGEIGVPIPADFQLYLKLGRFRNALIAAEQQRLDATNLSQFIHEYQLEPFRLTQASGK